MKKWIVLPLILLMVVCTACAGVPVISPTVPEKVPETTTATVDLPTDGAAVKTGMAIQASLGSSKDAGEEPGLAQSDITMVAVLVDDNGVITDCIIDALQAKISFDASGVITTDAATAVFRTKNELADAYGMKKASSIGKEWNEQMAALAEYAVGKTAQELAGIALNEKGGAGEADLATSVTVSIAGYIDAIIAAVDSATYKGAAQGDRLALGMTANMNSSKNATQEELGLAQAYATIAAVTFREDVITSCIIDAVQCDVKFDASGKISTDLTQTPRTKNQLGDDYGMKKASSIGKEWYEQAAAFSAYAVGKTVDELNGIAVNEKGAAADADLASSVTVSLGGFQEVISRAAG